MTRLRSLLLLGSALALSACKPAEAPVAEAPPAPAPVEAPAPAPEPAPIAETRDLGWMLHDLDFSSPVDPQPRFFQASMKDGVIQVPALDSKGVKS